MKEVNGQKIKQIFEKWGEKRQRRQGICERGGGPAKISLLEGKKGQIDEACYFVFDQSSVSTWGTCWHMWWQRYNEGQFSSLLPLMVATRWCPRSMWFLTLPLGSCQTGVKMELKYFPDWSHFQEREDSRNLRHHFPRVEKHNRHCLCILGDNSTFVLTLNWFFHYCAWISFAWCIWLNITFCFPLY